VDLGTGDGRSVLATATREPDTLAIGIDADAASMAEASRKAMRAAKRGCLPRALFVVAAAEALPVELDARADLLAVQFPWGSLLRGLLDGDPAIVSGIARVAKPGAVVTLLLSVTDRDRIGGRTSLDDATFAPLESRYAAHGLLVREARPATAEQLARSHSTWAKRLGAGSNRPVWYARFVRTACPSIGSVPHLEAAT
jgi:16S rRNA (adenine(1408)-N(1))-methyltransferase